MSPRLSRRLKIVLLTAAFLISVGYVLAFSFFNGPPLAKFVSDLVNGAIRGRITIGTIRWRPWLIVDLLLQRRTSIYVRDFRIINPGGVTALNVPEATARVRLLPLLLGGQLSLSDIRTYGGGTTFLYDTDEEKGFLATFKPRGEPSGSPFRLHLDAWLDRLAFEVRIGKAVRIVSAAGQTPFELDLDGPRTGLRLAPSAPVATLTLLGATFPITGLETKHIGSTDVAPHDLRFELSAHTLGSDVRLSGGLRDAFAEGPGTTLDLSVDLEHGGEVVRRLGRELVGPSLVFSGRDAKGRVHLGGPVDSFLLDADLANLEVAARGLEAPLRGVHGRVRWESATERVELADVSGSLGGGELSVHGKLDPVAGTFDSAFKLRQVDPAVLVPPRHRAVAAGRLSGSGIVKGSYAGTKPRVRMQDLSLVFQPGKGSPVPEALRVSGAAQWSGNRLELDGLRVVAAGVQATAKGAVFLRSGDLTLSVSARAADLAPLLAGLGLPPAFRHLASTLDLDGQVTGKIDEPAFEGAAVISNLGVADLRIPRVRAELSIKGPLLRARTIAGSGPAGSLTGQGTYDFTKRASDITLALRGLDLSRLDSRLVGRSDIDAHVSGPVAAPKGSLTLRAPAFTLDGDRYAAQAQAQLDGEGVRIQRLELKRIAGGTFAVTGSLDFKGNLDLHLDANRFPLGALPLVPRLPAFVSGTLSGKLSLGGTVKQPIPSGTVEIANARIRTIQLGTGRLDIVPGGDSIGLRGTFFDRFTLRGNVSLAPEFTLTVTLAFDGLAIEQMIPELLQYAELRGIATGTLRLSLAATGPPHIGADLTDLRVSAEGTEDDGTPRRVELANRGDISVIYDGKRLRFDALRLESDHGEVAIHGFLDPLASDLTVQGDLDLELLEYFARSAFKHTHGQTRTNLRVTGSMWRPALAGTLDLNKVTLEPRSFDRPISIPTGHATFTNNAVELSDLTVRMEEGTARARGRLDWSNWNIPKGHLEVAGKVPASFFSLLAPDTFADADGFLNVSVTMDGPIRSPALRGSVEITKPGITLEVRGYGRQLQILTAVIEMADNRLIVHGIRGKIDDGDLLLDGAMQLEQFRPSNIDLRIQASELPFRDPGVLMLTVAADLRLRGDLDHLVLGGRGESPGIVDIVDGRYIEQFESPLKSAVLRPRTREQTEPFWTGVPALENMALNFEVHSRGFFHVENNLARQVKLETHLAVTGTVSNPEIGGEIRVMEGAFSVPLLKGNEFIAVPGGTIIFYPYRRFPETPELNIQAEKSYTDNNDQDHLIRLKFTGPLGAPVWSLETNTGLNTAQTLVLLATGRPPTELRSALRGDSQGRGAAGGASDQLAKELSAGALQEIISDPLNRILRLDALSLYVGPQSVDVRARKRLIQRPRLNLVGLQSIGILNRSYFEGKVELKLHDNAFLEGELQRFSRGVETEQESLDRGKAQVRFQFRLR